MAVRWGGARVFWLVLTFGLGTGVLVLLGAATREMWRASVAGVERERARERAPMLLVQGGQALALAGGPILAIVPEWPQTLDPIQWDSLDEWLASRVRMALQGRSGMTGGYFIPQEDRFLGRTTAERGAADAAFSVPPEWLDAQVREAWRRDRAVSTSIEQSGQSIALRAEPLQVNGRRLAVIWTGLRFDDAPSRARMLGLYDRSARLALAGVSLAGLLALQLSIRLRAQAAQQRQLQADLRRSERLAALGKLLAGVAHEVRNPLAGLRSTAQLWQRGLTPDRETVADVLSEVDRLDELVGRLLQFSRAESRPRSSVDLNELLRELARRLEPMAEASAIDVVLELDARCPAPLADPDVLLQALRNLAANAIQAMSGGGRLTLSTRAGGSRRTAIVEVADTGCGLSAEVRSHLFEPFFTTRPEGTGLGLAIAHEIAVGHGGTLEAAPPGHEPGARFVLTLPAASAARSGPCPG